MAKEIEVKVVVNTDDAVKKFAATKEAMEDLRDEASTLRGSGIEKLNASFSLLKDSLGNADFGKAKTAFNGIGAAMKAIPIFLIVEGVRFLIEKFDDLKNSGGLLGKIFTTIGDIITTITQGFKDLTDAIGLTNNAIADQSEKTIQAAKDQEAAVTSRYDAEIKLAKASGKAVDEIELAKQDAIIKSAKIQFEAIKAVALANGTVSDEQMKQIKELGTLVLNAENEKKVIRATKAKETSDEIAKVNKEASDANKKILEQSTKDADDFNKQAVADSQKAYDDELALKEKQLKQVRNAEIDADAQAKIDADKAVDDEYQRLTNIAELKALNNQDDLQLQRDYLNTKLEQELSNTELTEEEKDLIRKKYAQQEIDLDKKVQAEKKKNRDKELSAAGDLTNALGSLSNTYYSNQIKAAEGDTKKQEELKKKQFQTTKAFNLASAVITGVKSVMSAYAGGAEAGGPAALATGAAYAVIAGVVAAANIAAIASQQYTGTETSASLGGSTSSGGGSVAGGGALSSSTLINGNTQGSTFNSNTIGNTNDVATGGSNSTGAPNNSTRVYVLESDITATQSNIVQIEQSNTF